jgi:hypothetical protein
MLRWRAEPSALTVSLSRRLEPRRRADAMTGAGQPGDEVAGSGRRVQHNHKVESPAVAET